jgi:hypothetical protein
MHNPAREKPIQQKRLFRRHAGSMQQEMRDK